MRFLYAVLVVSTVALVGAAFAIARAVRGHQAGERGKSLSLKSKPADRQHDD